MSADDNNSTAGGNTLWLTFLAAWAEEAQAKGSKIARTYRKAHQSLAACPIEFQHPCQTTQLSGIGPTIANKIEQELQKWCQENGKAMPERPSRQASTSKSKSASVTNDDGGAEARDHLTVEAQDGSHGAAKRNKGGASDRPTKKRAYVPQHRSGAYGLLVGLFITTRARSSLQQQQKVSKTQLINAARPYSDTEYELGGSSSRASAAVPLSSHHGTSGGSAGSSHSFYTGWTSIKTLIAKGYVLQSGNPARYALSDQGARIAETLAKDAGVEQTDVQDAADAGEDLGEEELDDHVSEDEQEDTLKARLSTLEPEVLKAGSYTIHLLVDNRERHRPGGRQEKEPIATLLLERGIDTETRALEVGDAVWIARRKNRSGLEADEVVLDHIVERKRLDDLTSSILDGRWKDQKFRLSSSGLSKVLYLIEDYDVEDQMGKFALQIQTALSSSQVVDGFFVERTSGLIASIDYLAAMDRIVRKIYEGRDLSMIPSAVISRSSFLQIRDELQEKLPSASILTSFEAFQALNSKSAGLTSKEVFGKMLLCIKGMSAEKVREMLTIYSTLRELSEAYQGPADETKEADDIKEADTLLSSSTENLDQRKKIGPALSRKVAQVFLQSRYPAE
ncbi:related to MUS81-endonuclease involved in DNA repair and replication fork stability [Ustilago bromivora]|uniref:Crossover junction endonuclease MUS81 n=1 Tax=Ustilago bromivora TaxID=307758 RepID=A0A1K0G7K2_9BASI|nr:related to MUS81-endonuclease involved in DNA repair and replication fork stability [Ustilago bromivora]SYW73831.1 related to MUS81 - endonuclease involved in DNA repair and replication fork stability [Ustilago bromivora]